MPVPSPAHVGDFTREARIAPGRVALVPADLRIARLVVLNDRRLLDTLRREGERVVHATLRGVSRPLGRVASTDEVVAGPRGGARPAPAAA